MWDCAYLNAKRLMLRLWRADQQKGSVGQDGAPILHIGSPQWWQMWWKLWWKQQRVTQNALYAKPVHKARTGVGGTGRRSKELTRITLARYI
jgi:hypothetical protein